MRPLAIAVAATRFGLGLSTDSDAYLAEARSLRKSASVDLPCVPTASAPV